MKISILIAFILVLTLSVNGQAYKGQSTEIDFKNLTREQIGYFQKETLKKIKSFQGHLSFIASRENSTEDKEMYKEITLENFINKGKGVYMEISSISPVTGKVKKITRTISAYLDKLATLPYARVELKAAKSCIMSNFIKYGEDQNGNPVYHATATYYQEFVGYNGEGKAVYRDVTKKTVEVELRRSTDIHGARWVVSLGSITVNDTTA